MQKIILCYLIILLVTAKVQYLLSEKWIKEWLLLHRERILMQLAKSFQ